MHRDLTKGSSKASDQEHGYFSTFSIRIRFKIKSFPILHTSAKLSEHLASPLYAVLGWIPTVGLCIKTCCWIARTGDLGSLPIRGDMTKSAGTSSIYRHHGIRHAYRHGRELLLFCAKLCITYNIQMNFAIEQLFRYDENPTFYEERQ